MDLQLEHAHPEVKSRERKKSHKQKEVFNAERQTFAIFDVMLVKSETKFNSFTTQTIKKMQKNVEQRVYYEKNNDKSNYMKVLVRQKIEKIAQIVQPMNQVINKKYNKIIKQIKNTDLVLQNNIKSSTDILCQLELYYETLRRKSPISITSQDMKRLEELQQKKLENYYEFRKKGYWLQDNVKNHEAQQLIMKMKRQRSLQMKKLRRLKKKQKERLQQQSQQKKHDEEEKQKQLKNKLSSSIQARKIHKQQMETQDQSKKIKISQFLNKFKVKAPLHLSLQRKYIKSEKQQQIKTERLLVEIRQSKKQQPIPQIRRRMKELQEKSLNFSKRYEEQMQKRHEQQKRINRSLSKLYKSRVFSSSLSYTDGDAHKNKIKKDQILKKFSYCEQVKLKHSPHVDQAKRQQIVKRIEQLKYIEQNPIRKNRNGQQIVINKQELNPREDGLKFLQQLKLMTSLVQRKPKIDKSISVKEEKLIDRSKLKNTFYNKKVTISNWKQIIQNEKLTNQQKQQKIDEYLKLIEQIKVRNVQEKRKSSMERKIQLEKQMDHYQLQKSQLKLSLLKLLK